MTSQSAFLSRKVVFPAIILSMIAVGLLRIASTYDVYWQTWDEPFHVAAGMEWLDKGRYTYELFHPPLARVMSAVGPYIGGARSMNKTNTWSEAWDEGTAILHVNDMYEHNLTMARIGILPFFIIASLVVALWAYKNWGKTASFLATFLFTTTPPILAHAGFATLDMACAALVAASLFSLSMWLANPTFFHSFLLGIIIGLALLAKLSALGFLIAAGGLTGAVVVFKHKNISNGQGVAVCNYRRWLTGVIIVMGVCTLSIWAGYRFSWGPLQPVQRPIKMIDRLLGNEGILHDSWYFLMSKINIPAPEFYRGLKAFMARDDIGHQAYLFGEVRCNGWWYYFPVVLMVKSSLPLIFFSFAGIFYIRNSEPSSGNCYISRIVPICGVIGILIVSMFGHVNNGVRQILSVYPLLAIIAGYGAFQLLSLNKRTPLFGIIIVILLLMWQLESSWAAHPNYLAYYNEIAKDRPDKFGVDSDLDWGQDLKRLASTVKKRGIDKLYIKYNGSKGIKLEHFGFPPTSELEPNCKVTGWIAISISRLTLGTGDAPYDQFFWLRAYRPVEKVGNSILLYHLPES